MTIDLIYKEVGRIKRKYSDSDPFKLCRAMKISLLYARMGTLDGACKGFYLVQSRRQAITINSDLSEGLQRVILTHELGHAVLHRNISAVKGFLDFELFDDTSQYEYQANIFAADYLMDDRDVLEVLNEDVSFFDAASTLRVPAELLDFKFRVLKRKGYKVIDPPMMANSDFLKRVK